ncbi:MAG: DUF4426 domain-containing protein [Gammaproteobacteria bacterium]|nr:DUF4426 domain-containing protein [Gammaproteobacteria bacterium]
MHNNTVLKSLGALLLALASFGAAAEQSVDVGEYVIHYNALNTDNLLPQVAQSYGITRSPNRVLLNVTVLKKIMGTTGKPVSADISATATNLNNQLYTIDMRQVDDGGAIYNLGTITVNHGDTLTFHITAVPEDTDTPYKLKFQRQFYVAR